MKKLSVTYHAPKGDSKVCEMFGHTFYDGKAEEVTVQDNIFEKLKRNQYFECGKESDVEAAKADPAARKAAEEAAKKVDDAHRAAQESSRYLRGMVSPNLPGEPEDDKSKGTAGTTKTAHA